MLVLNSFVTYEFIKDSVLQPDCAVKEHNEFFVQLMFFCAFFGRVLTSLLSLYNNNYNNDNNNNNNNDNNNNKLHLIS